MSFRERMKPFLSIVGILLAILLVFSGLNIYLLKPLKQDVFNVKNELSNEEKLIEILSAKQQKSHTLDQKDTVALQKKLPVQPLVDQFLLDLEKAEVFSDSLIISYGISEGEAEFKVPTSPELENPLDQPQTQASQPQENKESALSTITGSTDDSLPQGIKKLTFTLTVSSPDYEKMIEFLDRIEKQSRITVIDSLSFSGKPESPTVIHESNQELQYSVQLSTFYIPEWMELAKDLPEVDYKDPHGKMNPLYTEEVPDESNSTEKE
ncbi:hypothetical protein [Ammoniphilus sp. CFH 90114]|uniref:hypothetical protein n=1 Tax=Ammoniphilus sp. CFH 90114 TaxID=2493665 RepID=UPI00100FB005|nr:hypothetical protein [Ammoniphilus sp. CFH 90114]RXT14696.1 hypothetical protein EIZ39_00310 [Ammoniphilus sp. CFH 90114]